MSQTTAGRPKTTLDSPSSTDENHVVTFAHQIVPDTNCENNENTAVKGGQSCLSSYTNLSPTDLLGAGISLTASLVATGWLREDRSAFWFYFWMSIWPLLTALAKSISICTAAKWDDLAVNVAVEVSNTAVFLYYVSAPVYDDEGSIITFGYGNMEAYQMATLLAFGGANILIALFDYLSNLSKPVNDLQNHNKGFVEFLEAFTSFIIGLQMVFTLQCFTPSHPIRGDASGALLTIQLWASVVSSKDGVAAKPDSDADNRPPLMVLLTCITMLIVNFLPFVFCCVGLQGSSDLVYVIPPCQWPENVGMSVAAKLTRPMPGIIYDPLPPRSDCTMKNNFGWDLVANSSNLTRWGDYSAGKNSTKKYGVGPYDPIGTAWGVTSYDFISREKFNENYDAWVAAGLYFNNQTDSGKNSYDYVLSLIYIIPVPFSCLVFTHLYSENIRTLVLSCLDTPCQGMNLPFSRHTHVLYESGASKPHPAGG